VSAESETSFLNVGCAAFHLWNTRGRREVFRSSKKIKISF